MTEPFEKWADWDSICLNGLEGMIREYSIKPTFLSVSMYRACDGSIVPHTGNDLPELFKDLRSQLQKLVEDGILREPQEGDDAGSWGKCFWDTTRKMSVGELVDLLRERGFNVQKR